MRDHREFGAFGSLQTMLPRTAIGSRMAISTPSLNRWCIPGSLSVERSTVTYFPPAGRGYSGVCCAETTIVPGAIAGNDVGRVEAGPGECSSSADAPRELLAGYPC